MGVDTKGRLNGYIRPEEILNFIKQKYDAKAFMDKINISNYGLKKEKDYIHKDYDKTEPYAKAFHTSIIFEYEGEKRMMFYNYSNFNAYENLALYETEGLGDMVKSETTQISLGFWGHSIEIIKDIVTEFGGWVDENDCDDKPYYPIIKNPDGTVKPVFYVTMEEVFEKFGGVVIITSNS